MSKKAKELLKRALELPVEERTELATSLLATLDGPPDEGVEEAWDEEIARRIHEIDSGKVKMIPGEKAMKRLRAITRGPRLATRSASTPMLRPKKRST